MTREGEEGRGERVNSLEKGLGEVHGCEDHTTHSSHCRRVEEQHSVWGRFSDVFPGLILYLLHVLSTSPLPTQSFWCAFFFLLGMGFATCSGKKAIFSSQRFTAICGNLLQCPSALNGLWPFDLLRGCNFRVPWFSAHNTHASTERLWYSMSHMTKYQMTVLLTDYSSPLFSC